MMDDTRTDADLVRCFIDGDDDAFGILVDRYQRTVFNAAYRLMGNVASAKDVSQSVFLKVFEKLESFDGRLSFYSWLYRITVNEAINALKRDNRHQTLDDIAAVAATGPGPEESMAAVETGRHVQEALMRLKPEYRTVVVCRHILSMSYTEIAEITQLPEKTVKSRLFTARELLRGWLTEKGVVR